MCKKLKETYDLYVKQLFCRHMWETVFTIESSGWLCHKCGKFKEKLIL